ncbi:hypothetical protein [Pseudanabaena minima]|uniref:hypothetical protein n=1 Tax=Pseudanabaena minima TaxID=890415 RepID=UPI003DA8202D
MPFDWATQKQAYTGKLRILSLGVVSRIATGQQTITTNNATVTYVDCGTCDMTMNETLPDGITSTISAGSGTTNINAYGLPWGAGYASRTILGSSRNVFVTPRLDGCGIMIAGPTATPTIIHANCRPTDLLTPVQNDLPTYYRLWSDVYIAIASKMVSASLLPDNSLEMLLPKDYLLTGVSDASVFGVCEGGSWSFYVTLNKTSAGETRKIWG